MRITGGEFAGRILRAPKGPTIRMTLDHVRQAIFHLVGPRVQGAKVLDLFSGSGALGIEAISRGAAHATFVDRSYFCIQAIEANLEGLSLATRKPPVFTVMRADALTAIRWLHRKESTFDLILLDPPYGHHLARKSLKAIAQYGMVVTAGLVVAEHDKRDSLPAQIEGEEISLVRKRCQRYGDTALTIYERP